MAENPSSQSREAQSPPGVATAMTFAAQVEGSRLCALGHHAWLPWLANPNGRSFHTYCDRCNKEAQYDL